jgi:acyl carrier protein
MPDWPPEFESLVRQRCRLLDPGVPLDPAESLVVLGVDSLEVIELIVTLEAAFDFEFPAAQLVPEVFATPASVWQAIENHV